MNNDALHKAICALALPTFEAGGNEVPAWIHIMPAGSFSGRDGRGPYVLEDAEAVVAASMALAPSTGVPMDYEHQIEHSLTNGQPAPASGWIPELQARADGIWARVDWTERAAAHVAAREYRFVSPVFLHGKDGRVCLIESVALTNLPNLTLKSLARTGQKEGTMPFDEQLTAITKLNAELDKASEQQAVAVALAERDALKALHSQLSAVFGVEDATELLKAAQCIKAQAETPNPAKFVPFATYEALHKELASLKSAQTEAEAERLLAKARSEGKIIPATEEHFKALAKADPSGFEQLMNVLPDLRPGAGNSSVPGAVLPAASSGALTETDKAVFRAIGVSEESYLKTNGGRS